ncbi:hypothetical protein [Pareuzebyella sediminis]|uniref:hypothetical protein n=1 Tax=Pareuzebyella sediminis TaxID=2607998 RepID=UPI0011EF6987|nr:hypothetical protein [Pareuzebyella sediminis]
MQLLFPHKYKRFSGWIFYLTLPIAIYTFLTESKGGFFVFKVYSLFSIKRTVITEYTENVYGSDGFRWIENDLLNEVLIAVIIVSGIINSFSKEKLEDELIAKLRTESLTLSLYLNYLLVLMANFLIYELTFSYVLVFNLFAILVLFNLIFKYRLYTHYQS